MGNLIVIIGVFIAIGVFCLVYRLLDDVWCLCIGDDLISDFICLIIALVCGVLIWASSFFLAWHVDPQFAREHGAVECQDCGASLNGTDRFCSDCGTELKYEKKHCTECGEVIGNGDKFCAGCGSKVKE